MEPMTRIYTLQYLRALAALAVVALHGANRVADALPAAVASVLALGHAGVDLFFVISGFIMWSIARNSALSPATFLARRIIRVAPSYWIATLVWVGLVSAIGYDWITVTAEHTFLSLGFVPHFSATFADRVWPVLIPGWTLNYEMFFYLVFAGTLLAGRHLRLSILSAVLVGLVGLGWLAMPTQAIALTWTNPLLLEFLAGCLVAEFWMHRPGGVLRNALVLATALGALAAFGLAVDDAEPWSRVAGFGLPAALIVSGAVGLSGRVPRIAGLERLGDASYAIYLFHLFVLLVLTEAWLRLPVLHGPAGAIAFIVAGLVLSGAVGLVVLRHVETPLQRMLTRMIPARPWRAHAASR